MNQNFYSMIDRYKHQQLRIGPVSPQQIRAWANKILPNGEIVGEVTKPYTFHYKTNKPEKDGMTPSAYRPTPRPRAVPDLR